MDLTNRDELQASFNKIVMAETTASKPTTYGRGSGYLRDGDTCVLPEDVDVIEPKGVSRNWLRARIAP